MKGLATHQGFETVKFPGRLTQSFDESQAELTEQQSTLEPLQTSENLNIDTVVVKLQHDVARLNQQSQRLAQKLARYGSVIEGQAELICRFQADGTLTLVNMACCRFFGRPKKRLLGQNLFRLLYSDPQEQLAPPLLIHDRSEQQVVSFSGDTRWLQWHTTAIYDVQGHLREYQSTGRDISDRKRTEDLLLQQLARERLVFKITQQLYQSLDLDQILRTVVNGVREFLQVDRVMVHCLAPDGQVTVMAESVQSAELSILGQVFRDPVCSLEQDGFQSSRVSAIADVFEGDSLPAYRQCLVDFSIRANLVVPILRGPHQVWGLLQAHSCTTPRQWQTSEIELLQQLTTQVAIAMQQTELYQKLQSANQELQTLASSDGLTQVANRRRFDEYLAAEWKRTARERQSLSLILCDVDFFKRYNDHYGHQAGDQCLQELAQALSNAARRPADLVARYGGEEFAIILPGTSEIGAIHVANSIQTRIADLQIAHEFSDVLPFVTLSLGIATITPQNDLEPTLLVKAADQALYQAKAKGRNQYYLETLASKGSS
jgi:diguanylate cyclase (GGDEF)-like protein/PAS domain S-box-containing protein